MQAPTMEYSQGTCKRVTLCKELRENAQYFSWLIKYEQRKHDNLDIIKYTDFAEKKAKQKLTFNHLKMSSNDLDGLSSHSQNDLDTLWVKCTKFKVSIFVSFEVIVN